MSTVYEVMKMLRPQGGWILSGDSYKGLEFLECEPITEKQLEAGFAAYDAWKAEQDAKVAADKAAFLAKLGITEDDLKTLLS